LLGRRKRGRAEKERAGEGDESKLGGNVMMI
jgi:hypothetical protein